MPTKTVDPQKCITGEVRCSYVTLSQPRVSPNDEREVPKYSLVALIPKSDTETLAKIRAAEAAAAEAGKVKQFGGTIPKKLASILHDGDEEGDLEKNPEYENHWYMSVTNTQRPGVVDTKLKSIEDERQLYSGMYARLSLRAYPYNQKGNKGISFALNNVMKTRDGEPFGGVAASAEDDFADFAEEGSAGSDFGADSVL